MSACKSRLGAACACWLALVLTACGGGGAGGNNGGGSGAITSPLPAVAIVAQPADQSMLHGQEGLAFGINISGNARIQWQLSRDKGVSFANADEARPDKSADEFILSDASGLNADVTHVRAIVTANGSELASRAAQILRSAIPRPEPGWTRHVDAKITGPKALTFSVWSDGNTSLLANTDGELFRTDLRVDSWLQTATMPLPKSTERFAAPLLAVQGKTVYAYTVFSWTEGIIHKLFKSSDLGYSWREITMPKLPMAMVRLLLLDSHTLLGLDAAGQLWKTSDGGLTWKPLTIALPSGAGMPPTDIGREELTGRLYAGAGGANAPLHVATSDDMGASWRVATVREATPQAVSVRLDFRPDGVLLQEKDLYQNLLLAQWRSQDQGRNWVREPSDGSAMEAAWISPRSTQSCNALVAYQWHAARYTEDAGKTWHPLPAGWRTAKPSAQEWAGVPTCLPDGSIVLFKASGQAQRSVDRGATWQSYLAVPRPGENAAKPIIALGAADNGTIWAVDDRIWTHDGGRWHLDDPKGELEVPNALDFNHKGQGIYKLGNRLYLRNSAATGWQRAPAPASPLAEYWLSICTSPGLQLLENGRLYCGRWGVYSDDQGQNWEHVAGNASFLYQMPDLCMRSDISPGGKGTVDCFGGNSFLTEDFGANWRVLALPLQELGDHTGWGEDGEILAIGLSGVVRASTDGGGTWTTRGATGCARNSWQSPQGVWSLGAGQLLLACQSPSMYRNSFYFMYSRDKGKTWTKDPASYELDLDFLRNARMDVRGSGVAWLVSRQEMIRLDMRRWP